MIINQNNFVIKRLVRSTPREFFFLKKKIGRSTALSYKERKQAGCIMIGYILET